jgi:hypothetical protein
MPLLQWAAFWRTVPVFYGSVQDGHDTEIWSGLLTNYRIGQLFHQIDQSASELINFSDFSNKWEIWPIISPSPKSGITLFTSNTYLSCNFFAYPHIYYLKYFSSESIIFLFRFSETNI